MRTYSELANDIIDAMDSGDSEAIMLAADEATERGFVALGDWGAKAFDVVIGNAQIDDWEVAQNVIAEKINALIASPTTY